MENEKTAASQDKPTYFGRDLEAMSFAANYHAWIIDEFRPYVGSAMAEVGAGTGSFSELLAETGIRSLVAFEPSANMYPLLEERLRARPMAQAVNAFFGDECHRFENAFDSVAYVNVLEHIEKDSEELAYVKRALKPGGHLLVFVPALQFLYSDLDKNLGHFRRYHKAGLTRVVSSAGFRILKVKYFDLAGVLPWYVAITLLKRPMSGGNVSLYDKLVVPVTRRFESLVTPPFGKNLLLIAQKT